MQEQDAFQILLRAIDTQDVQLAKMAIAHGADVNEKLVIKQCISAPNKKASNTTEQSVKNGEDLFPVEIIRPIFIHAIKTRNIPIINLLLANGVYAEAIEITNYLGGIYDGRTYVESASQVLYAEGLYIKSLPDGSCCAVEKSTNQPKSEPKYSIINNTPES